MIYINKTFENGCLTLKNSETMVEAIAIETPMKINHYKSVKKISIGVTWYIPLKGLEQRFLT